MPEEWFDVAYIGFDEAILHGRMTAGTDEHGCRIENAVRIVLTEEQKERIEEMNDLHRAQMQRLLGDIAQQARP